MANHQARTPMAVRMTGHALSFEETPATTAADLFGLTVGKPDSAPHPDFEARTAIWRDQRAGLISMAEAQRRSALVGSAILAKSEDGVLRFPRKTHRPRRSRPAPNESRQYAAHMSTTAARDDRLTPNAKALLQVLRARAGKGASTQTTKFTLAAVMSRSARTIARYLRDLEWAGYITTEIRRNSRGLHLGLVVSLCEKVLPFFEEANGLAAWLAETPKALSLAFTGRPLGLARVTKLTPINQTGISNPIESKNTARSEESERRLRHG